MTRYCGSALPPRSNSPMEAWEHQDFAAKLGTAA
jgi:hypothetical protein